jgi:hypothetical protein
MLEPGRKLPESGALIFGEKETIMHGSHGAGGVRIIPETRMQSFQRPAKTIPRVKGGHEKDWIRACKGGPAACSNFSDYGGQLTEMVLLGVVAQRMPGVVLKWDGAKMEFDHPEANEFLHKTYRKGWSLGEEDAS